MTSDDFNSDNKPDLAVANGSSNTVSVLLGNGSPDPVANPTGLSFPAQGSGTPSSAQTVTVINPLDRYRLSVGQVSITGANAPDFTISSETCTAALLEPSGTCEVQVRFGPSNVGSSSATLEISHDGDASPLRVPLTGTLDISPPTARLTVSPDLVETGGSK